MTLNKEEVMLILEALHSYRKEQNDNGKKQIEELSMKLRTEVFKHVSV